MTKPEIILETPNRKVVNTVSVIMTSYGRDVLLTRAIRSVLQQSYTDFSLIIIDDNSPLQNKKTQNIISKFAAKDERIVYFRTLTKDEERKKISTFCRNINFMLRYIQDTDTKYVCYLPCDDYFHPDRLKIAVEYLNKHKHWTACWSYVKLVNKINNTIGKVPNTNLKPIYNAMAVLDHSCVTHRTKILQKLNYPFWPLSKSIEFRAPDGEFFNKLIKASGPIYPTIAATLGYKTQHAESIQGRAYGWVK